MKEIKLTQNKITLVDDEDFEWLSKHRWYFSTGGYAQCSVTNLLMQFMIMKPIRPMEVDHIDRNKLNNQKYNLRLCTHQQNNMNVPSKGGTSQYKGVYWNEGRSMWTAEIRFNNNKIYIGRYEDEYKASLAYDYMARKLFKEFAYLNHPSIISDIPLTPMQEKKKSKYVGVSKQSNYKRWTAAIKFNGKSFHLGQFDSEEEAAIAYNAKATELRGHKAKLNVIDMPRK